ncbi:MAG: hypothetical protein FVQ78_08580 [Solirubrobacterales bacterium]|nr:hypothetical protein [Solirubrobacterales bacterium]
MRRVLIVGVRESEVEAVLCRGVGPELPPEARCPACGGELGRWGGYRRWVRRREEMFLLRVARAICRSCERTHALLPSFLYARRLDLAEMIFEALAMGAQGRGHHRQDMLVPVLALGRLHEAGNEADDGEVRAELGLVARGHVQHDHADDEEHQQEGADQLGEICRKSSFLHWIRLLWSRNPKSVSGRESNRIGD